MGSEALRLPHSSLTRSAFLRGAVAAGAVATASRLLAQVAPRDGPIEKMKPGSYYWAPQVAPDGPVTIIVSLKAQKAFAYRNGVPIGVSTVSTGKPGHETPTGVFTILQKNIDHKSNLYDDAPMPYMQRLTWDGIAIHAGKLPGYPASHGCVRLPMEFAKLLYGITKLGLTVVITDEAEVPVIAPPPRALAGGHRDEHQAPTAYLWEPEKSRRGPISIVLSGRDNRIVVLRNGIEIGSAAVIVDEPITETMALTLRAIDAAGFHWMRLPLPGQGPDKAAEIPTGNEDRVHVPEAFRVAVRKILAPGATVLVTRDSLRNGGTGTRLTVLDSDKG